MKKKVKKDLDGHLVGDRKACKEEIIGIENAFIGVTEHQLTPAVVTIAH